MSFSVSYSSNIVCITPRFDAILSEKSGRGFSRFYFCAVRKPLRRRELNCPDALYLANLNAFPDLDSSEEFPDKIHCPTSLVYNNSKILFSCKYNKPNQLLILEQ